ncbi:MAG: hypothetical protein AB7O98_13580 [Hyphomonadaceae bacterium]
MRKYLFAAAGLAALAGVTGVALAQSGGERPERPGWFQADANNDGVLTRQEFDAGSEARFAQMDSNNDGQLSREERRESRAERREGRRGGHHRGGGWMLTRADANEDGNITRDEFLARPIEHFNRLDANSDGVISAEERPQRGDRGARAERRGDRPNPDANGDNQISRAEFVAMSGSMFERLDANDDGRVTQEEAQAARPHRRGQ